MELLRLRLVGLILLQDFDDKRRKFKLNVHEFRVVPLRFLNPDILGFFEQTDESSSVEVDKHCVKQQCVPRSKKQQFVPKSKK